MWTLQDWIRELSKYSNIINQARHLKVQSFNPRSIQQYVDMVKQQIDSQVRDCAITNHPGATNVPLSAGRAIFESNLSEEQIDEIIRSAEVFLHYSLERVINAARNNQTHL